MSIVKSYIVLCHTGWTEIILASAPKFVLGQARIRSADQMISNSDSVGTESLLLTVING